METARRIGEPWILGDWPYVRVADRQPNQSRYKNSESANDCQVPVQREFLDGDFALTGLDRSRRLSDLEVKFRREVNLRESGVFVRRLQASDDDIVHVSV
ncbi:MAG: hypothetical protein HYU75_21255 [Betaproteobacteria bacterium]|nr:hypothetical protein [Betaproteobacteria bacterium]